MPDGGKEAERSTLLITAMVGQLACGLAVLAVWVVSVTSADGQPALAGSEPSGLMSQASQVLLIALPIVLVLFIALRGHTKRVALEQDPAWQMLGLEGSSLEEEPNAPQETSGARWLRGGVRGATIVSSLLVTGLIMLYILAGDSPPPSLLSIVSIVAPIVAIAAVLAATLGYTLRLAALYRERRLRHGQRRPGVDYLWDQEVADVPVPADIPDWMWELAPQEVKENPTLAPLPVIPSAPYTGLVTEAAWGESAPGTDRFPTPWVARPVDGRGWTDGEDQRAFIIAAFILATLLLAGLASLVFLVFQVHP